MSEPDPSDVVDDASEPPGHGDSTETLEETDIATLESRLSELASQVDTDVEDLRERLVRIYRDVQRKAEADHTHSETADRIDTLDAALDDLEETTVQLDETLAALAERMDDVESDADATAESIAAAENRLDGLETRVERLADANDDAMEKLSRVASAVVRTQRAVRMLEHERTERDRLDGILAEANRHGVRTADCEGCGNTVRLSLLSKPECPYCESRIGGVDPGRRFFGTSRLRVDDTPALEGDIAATGRVDDDADDPAGPDVSARDAGIDEESRSRTEDGR